MFNSATVDIGKEVYHVMCAGRSCRAEWEYIRHYYSIKHMGRDGWKFELRPEYSNNRIMTLDNSFAYCPECNNPTE